jgi:hypothetical protein
MTGVSGEDWTTGMTGEAMMTVDADGSMPRNAWSRV